MWELAEGKAETELITKLENGICPECGKPVSWGKARDINWLKLWTDTGQAASIGAGYWIFLEK